MRLVSFSLLILTLVLFVVMVKLGMWQLSRAEEKTNWQQALTSRSQQQPLNLNKLQNLIGDDDQTNLSGYRLQVKATPITNKLLMLDNQVYQGKVGYLVFQPLKFEHSKKWLLLELGFVEANHSRHILPKVKEIILSQQFIGRLYQKSLNPFSYELSAEKSWPKRIQNLNFKQLETEFKNPLYPIVLQPEDKLLTHLPHPWLPIPMPAKKHQGYALQWFSMAAALFILMLIFICKAYKKPTT